MPRFSNFIPVRAISLKGWLLLKLIRFLYKIRKWLGFTNYDSPLEGHHEDPLKMTLQENIYLGFKYYYKAMVNAEPGSGTEEYFKRQTLVFEKPIGFEAESRMTLGAAGDLIPYACLKPENCTDLWQEAGSYLFDNDLVFANLESPVYLERPASPAPEIMLNDMYFNVDEALFRIFSGNGQYKGYDILSIANNHSIDMAEKGLLATQQFLTQKQIAYTGSAPTPDALHQFPILERKGIKTAFLAYTFSLNKEKLGPEKSWLCNHLPLNEANPDISLIVEQATIARQRGADLIVASLHMGCAYQAYPNLTTIKNIHSICEKTGIGVIIAGHAHHPQPFEIYESRHAETGAAQKHLIIYSLGDFIAYDIFKWGHLPLIVQLEITKGNVNGKLLTLVTGLKVKPFYMHRNKNGQLRLLDFLKINPKDPVFEQDAESRKELTELQEFFNQFIIGPAQKHVLENWR